MRLIKFTTGIETQFMYILDSVTGVVYIETVVVSFAEAGSAPAAAFTRDVYTTVWKHNLTVQMHIDQQITKIIP